MRIGHLTVAATLAFALAAPAPGGQGSWGGAEAQAGKAKKSKKKRKGKKDRYFKGHGVDRDELRAEPLTRPSGDLWIYAENFREELKVNIYSDPAQGAFDDDALAQLDNLFRCKRTGEKRAVDPRLYQTLSVIQDHFGKRLELVSGFRFQENESSRHYHASAADFRIEGVSDREIYEFAESLDAGGMGIGIYPTSGFIHIDYRAPGEPSFRWTDWSGPSGGKKKGKKSKGSKKSPGRTQPARKPVS